MSNVVISAYVSVEVADKISAIALAEDRTKSKIAGRFLEKQLALEPAPVAHFARRARQAKQEGKL